MRCTGCRVRGNGDGGINVLDGALALAASCEVIVCVCLRACARACVCDGALALAALCEVIVCVACG